MAPRSTSSAVVQHITRTIALLVAFVLVAGIGGVVAAGLLAPVATGVSAATNATQTIFDELPEELEPQPLPQSSEIRDAHGNILAVFYDQNRLVVPLDDISVHLQNAVIATEDHRFYEHGGVDPEGLIRALLVNQLSDRTEGASTLTQQYVKNVLINNALLEDDQAAVEIAREQTEERKLREMKLAITLEQRMTKDQILEGYLNIAQFGSSVYGVEAASRFYFGKGADQLNIVEAATIAGVTQAPNRWDPSVNPEEAQQRRDWVLGRMLRDDHITQEEHDDAVAMDIEDYLNIQPVRVGCEVAGDAGHFCDYVTKVITSDPVFGETRKERAQLLLRGGLVIHTTLDRDMQRAAMEEVTSTVPGDNPHGVASAIVTVRPGTGEIVAMAQNRRYSTSSEPDPGFTSVNYSTSQGLGGSRGFQPGSTFKPIVLAEWLKQGHNLQERVSAQGRTWQGSDWTAECMTDTPFTGEWRPGNVEGSGSGSMSVLQATSRSINTAYTHIAAELDLCDIADTATDLGFVPSGTADEGQVEITPAMILGTQDVAPLDMANTYATFASGGTHCEPIAITSVQTRTGEDLEVPRANCTQVLDSSISNGVNHALQDAMSPGSSGQAAALSDGRPAAGKTGTTNGNRHLWFVGYTPDLSTAIWVGHPDGNNFSLNYITLGGRSYDVVYGSTIPAPMWQRYMSVALEDIEPSDFPDVNDIILEGRRVTVPDVTGMWPNDARARLEQEDFRVVQSREPVDSAIGQGLVAEMSPGAYSRAPERSTITLTLSTGVDPDAEDDDDGDDDNGDDDNGDDDDDNQRRGRRGRGRGGDG